MGPKIGSMQGFVPHGAGSNRIVWSSAIVGSRQSQYPAKHPLTVTPLLVASFSVPRKVVNAVP